MVRFMVITGDEQFYTRLRRIAAACGWQIGRAESVEEAERLIVRSLNDAQPAPIVIYERDPDPDDGNWRYALRRLNESPAEPCVLLASQVADGYLWQEVVTNHGYDILPKSASDEKIIHCLKVAWFYARVSGHPEKPGPK